MTPAAAMAVSSQLASTSTAGLGADRRRTPRLEVNGRIDGYLESTGEPVRIRDIGLGGFSIETPDPVPDGVHVMRFSVEGQWSISLSAMIRYSRPFSTVDGASWYLTGFEYLAQHSRSTQRIASHLVERLTSILHFE
jgi:hypothetical protein